MCRSSSRIVEESTSPVEALPPLPYAFQGEFRERKTDEVFLSNEIMVHPAEIHWLRGGVNQYVFAPIVRG